jgi:phosphoglycerate dehydrogenase-like enzyme
MPTILLMQELKDKYIEQIRQAAPGWQIVRCQGDDVREEQLREAEIAVGWEDEWMERVLADPQARLKWIQNWNAGVDHIPLQTLKEKGVILTNISGVHPFPISESVFAMMLGLTRKIHIYVRNQTKRLWADRANGNEMHGKTLGILGFGTIGEEIARIARAFDMKVLGYKRTPAASPHADEIYVEGQLREMLVQCDYVVNILPLTSKTRRLIDAEKIGWMKPGAYFINVGRGGTVDTEALMEALTSGKLAGAGLDVFETEPLPPEHPLYDLDNVILTPHNAGGTARYNQRALDIFLANLRQYMAGEAPSINVIDYDRQY